MLSHCTKEILIGNRNDFLFLLITQKGRGELTYSSRNVIIICKKAQASLWIAQHKNTLYKQNYVLSLTNKIMGLYVQN